MNDNFRIGVVGVVIGVVVWSLVGGNWNWGGIITTLVILTLVVLCASWWNSPRREKQRKPALAYIAICTIGVGVMSWGGALGLQDSDAYWVLSRVGTSAFFWAAFVVFLYAINPPLGGKRSNQVSWTPGNSAATHNRVRYVLSDIYR